MTVTVIGYMGNGIFVAVIDTADPEDQIQIAEELSKKFRSQKESEGKYTQIEVPEDDIEIYCVIRGQPEILLDNTTYGWTSLR